MSAAVQHWSPLSAGRARGRRALASGLLACSLFAGASLSAAEPLARHPLIGLSAPDFVQPLFTGRSRNFRLSERRGEVLVLGFWTSWCGSCRSYLERLGRLDATYASAGLVVVGISLDDDLGRATELTRAVGVHFRNAWASDKELGRIYRVGDVPLTLLIDREGVVRYAQVALDAGDDAALIEQLRRLLDE
jgi:thiol-disulfide isomerase/thioredoxin